jgi:hypothetical protein
MVTLGIRQVSQFVAEIQCLPKIPEPEYPVQLSDTVITY